MNISQGIASDRHGRKAHLPDLRRKTESIPIPTEGIQNAAPSNLAARPSPYYMNNEDLFLIPSPHKNVKCGSCRNDILWKTTDAMVFKHFERYTYPTEKGPGNKWKKVTISNTRTRPVYYHAKAECIYTRFPKDYFDRMPVQIEASVDIRRIHGFTHPQFQ